MNEERRRHKRYAIEGMDVQCRMFFTTAVKILNISLGGVSLSLNKRLNMGEEYTLKIESKTNTITLKGVVVWANIAGHTEEREGNKVPIYEVGIRFSDVLTGTGNDLLHFIGDNICDKAIKTRIQGVRLRITDPEEILVLDDRDSFDVKVIGLGGMLIESKEELEVDGRFQMEMSFSEEMKPITFLGRTAYCVEIPGKRPKRYDTGIEFMEMEQSDRDRLKRFIDMLQNI